MVVQQHLEHNFQVPNHLRRPCRPLHLLNHLPTTNACLRRSIYLLLLPHPRRNQNHRRHRLYHRCCLLPQPNRLHCHFDLFGVCFFFDHRIHRALNHCCLKTLWPLIISRRAIQNVRQPNLRLLFLTCQRPPCRFRPPSLMLVYWRPHHYCYCCDYLVLYCHAKQRMQPPHEHE